MRCVTLEIVNLSFNLERRAPLGRGQFISLLFTFERRVSLCSSPSPRRFVTMAAGLLQLSSLDRSQRGTPFPRWLTDCRHPWLRGVSRRRRRNVETERSATQTEGRWAKQGACSKIAVMCFGLCVYGLRGPRELPRLMMMWSPNGLQSRR